MTKYALKQKRVRTRRRYVEEIKRAMEKALPGVKIEWSRPVMRGANRYIKYCAQLPGAVKSAVITGVVE